MGTVLLESDLGTNLYNSIRIIVIAVGFFSAVRAISIPYAESTDVNA